MSIELLGEEAHEDEVLIDSIVQEKNITYSTNSKLHERIIEKVNGIVKKEGIKLRQTYIRTTKQLIMEQSLRESLKERKRSLQQPKS